MRPKIHCVIPPFCPAPANHARFSYNRLTSRQTQYRLLHLGTNLITYFNTPSLSAQHPNRSSLPTRPFSTSYMMASDADYMSFLDKANQDVSGGDPKQGDMETQTVHSSISVPEALKSVEIRNIYYVSDTDEPFEPVALERDEKSPRAEWPGAGMSLTCSFAPLFPCTKQLPEFFPLDLAKLHPYSSRVFLLDLPWDRHRPLRIYLDSTLLRIRPEQPVLCCFERRT